MQEFLERAGLGLFFVVIGTAVLIVRNVPAWRDHDGWAFADGGMSRRTNKIIASGVVIVGLTIAVIGLVTA